MASRTRAFTALDWALVVAVAAMWGSSFLFIAIGIEHLRPGLVAFLRLAFGAATLALVPAARSPLARSAWPEAARLGVIWMAVPFMLFAIAEQWIDSSLAGLINGSAPLFTALVAGIAARQLPAGRQATGLAIGFGGVVAISAPSLAGADATALGAGLVLAATLLYGVAFNLAGPLEERHGALPVVWRAQLIAALLLLPVGLASLPGSSFAWSSLLAVAALGAVGTGVAFVAFVTLVGHVGPTRASVTTYFIPMVAVVLGVLFRDEAVAAVSLLGMLLAAAGAYLVSRGDR